MTDALILMSTYNGATYLAEQIESIRNQTYPAWNLLIRDDGSTDNTLEIIQRYSELDSRIRLAKDNLGNLRPAQSFSALLHHAKNSNEPFIFFSDQDDVWIQDKLSLLMSELKNLTEQQGENVPLLVFSDLQVVDQQLKNIHRSFLEYENLTPPKNPLPALLIHNWIAGCSAAFNRTLLNMASPIPKIAFMHDWWLALCAAAQGKILFCNRATVLYRQHEKNIVGSAGFAKRFKKILLNFSALPDEICRYTQSIRTRFQQAEELKNRLDEKNQNNDWVELFCQLKNTSRLLRPVYAIKQKFFPQGKLRVLGFLVLLVFV